MNNTTIKPLHNNVLIKPLDEEEQQHGNIIMPDIGKEMDRKGEVIAVGPGQYTITGEFIKVSLLVGEIGRAHV